MITPISIGDTANLKSDITIVGCSTQCLKKLCKIVLSKLRQIYTNFDKFWQKDGKKAKIMRGALSFHLT